MKNFYLSLLVKQIEIIVNVVSIKCAIIMNRIEKKRCNSTQYDFT